MATMVCQGLQSCLETEPRKFRLKLSSPRTHFISHDHLAFIKPLFEEIRTNTTTAPTICNYSDDKVSPDDMGGWTFLQSLSSAGSSRREEEEEEEEKPYVHPMSKRSLSSLSAKSLELCTENLGSETGSSDMLDDGDTIFNVQANSSCRVVGEQVVSPCRQLCRARDKKTAASTTREFPPPLTTISGSSSDSSIRMRSHRDCGRLVIEAEKVPSRRNIFKAERSNGRLRLLLTVENEEAADDEGDTDENEEAKFCNEEDDEEGDIDGNEEKVGGEMEMEKKQKDVSGNGSGRCKGGGEHESENKGLLKCEPLMVATS